MRYSMAKFCYILGIKPNHDQCVIHNNPDCRDHEKYNLHERTEVDDRCRTNEIEAKPLYDYAKNLFASWCE